MGAGKQTITLLLPRLSSTRRRLLQLNLPRLDILLGILIPRRIDQTPRRGRRGRGRYNTSISIDRRKKRCVPLWLPLKPLRGNIIGGEGRGVAYNGPLPPVAVAMIMNETTDHPQRTHARALFIDGRIQEAISSGNRNGIG